MPRKKSAKPLLLVGDRHREEDDETHGGCDDDDDDDEPPPSDPITCLSLLKHDCSKPVEKLSEAYGRWREERRTSAWRMERQLRARWTLDQLIDSELARFDAHFNRSMLPARPRDVGRLLLAPWKLPLENAALSWLGDWRPSAILSLIPVLAANSALLPLSPRALRALAEAARRIRVHEAVLEEEAAEYQTTCVLDLPFGRRRGTGGGGGAARAAAAEVRKMQRVVERAQRLRFRALEVAVKGVLDRTQAAEFLVAFAGIQELVHRQAARWRARTGPVSITLHALTAAR
uniref:Uncharacterized protein LOC105050137 n=1 Tax=Elaeis guineensis var. tenera TaxID=51953 RepID=A0A6I9RKK4_ELAGV|nr:uncharacterized protein LOC105050137 [Elaeis guineensis]